MSTTPAKKPETLEVTTPSDLEIAMTRFFDAPRRLVFDAHVKPELLRRWMVGPEGRSRGRRRGLAARLMDVASYDPEGAVALDAAVEAAKALPSDGWLQRLVEGDPFGPVMGPGDGALVTQVLEEEGARTKFTQTMRFGSREERDGALKSGMTEGTAICYDRLAEILADAA